MYWYKLPSIVEGGESTGLEKLRKMIRSVIVLWRDKVNQSKQKLRYVKPNINERYVHNGLTPVVLPLWFLGPGRKRGFFDGCLLWYGSFLTGSFFFLYFWKTCLFSTSSNNVDRDGMVLTISFKKLKLVFIWFVVILSYIFIFWMTFSIYICSYVLWDYDIIFTQIDKTKVMFQFSVFIFFVNIVIFIQLYKCHIFFISHSVIICSISPFTSQNIS